MLNGTDVNTVCAEYKCFILSVNGEWCNQVVDMSYGLFHCFIKETFDG